MFAHGGAGVGGPTGSVPNGCESDDCGLLAVNKKEQQPGTSTSWPRINEHSMLLVHHNIFLRCQKLIQSKNICEDICGISAIGLLLRTGPRVCGEPGLLTTKLT